MGPGNLEFQVWTKTTKAQVGSVTPFFHFQDK